MRLLVTNIERESCDDRRFSFEPVGAPRSLTIAQVSIKRLRERLNLTSLPTLHKATIKKALSNWKKSVMSNIRR